MPFTGSDRHWQLQVPAHSADRTGHSRGADSRARRKTSGWYRLALKWHQPPNLSLRGGRRPTWQSREGSCDFADGFPVVRPCSARLPRRFAPRNDTSGAFTIITIGCSDRQHCAGAGCPLPYNGVCGRRQYAQICCCQRRSPTAATDAIGFYVFNGSLYELQVPSRDCHGSCGASQ